MEKPARTERASSVVLLSYKDDTLRFGVDNEELNSFTVGYFYPLQKMDECLDSVGSPQVVPTLYANSDYGIIEVDETN